MVDMNNSDCTMVNEKRLSQVIKAEEEILIVNYQCYLSVQGPMSRSLPLPYKSYESTFERIFLFLERRELFGFARTV